MFGLRYSPSNIWKIAGGGANDPLTPPNAPTLTLTSGASDLTPDFSILFDSGPLEDDVVRVYDQTLGLLASHTITAGEAGGNPIALGLSALSAGSYVFYATHGRGGAYSSASNTQSITLTASAGQAIGLLLALTKAA